MNFQNELCALITRAKEAGYDIGEMIADMEGEIDGLRSELEDDEE